MDLEIGALIKKQRSLRGWTQAELTRRLGDSVGQQSVSRWERDKSRPSREIVVMIAGVFDLDHELVLRAAGYAPSNRRHQTMNPPVRPLMTALPLMELAPTSFEDFCADLLRAKYASAETSRYGSQGHKQAGIDGQIEYESGELWTFQCKRVKEFGPSRIRDAVSANAIEAERHLLLLARTATPAARKEIRNYTDWRLWDLEDLSREVRDLPKDKALNIVDTYFPGWRTTFLGIEEPGPWLTLETISRASGTRRVYSHDWILVGRQKELQTAAEFLENSEAEISLLEGRGGLGKTRLLYAIAQQVEPEWAVRFIDPGIQVEARHFELLPTTDKLLVVIDDVHDRDDLTALILRIRQHRPGAKMIAAMRPYGRLLVESELRKAGIHSSEIPTWPLEDLTANEAATLVREALGQSANDGLTNRLAAISRDCPLVGVVGAALIDRGDLDPSVLEGSEEFRDEILRAFHNVMVRTGDGSRDADRTTILDVIAAIQPFRINDPSFRTLLEKISGTPIDRLTHAIRSLEEDGVVLRRSDSLRIVPDLLGDIVLADAMLDSGGNNTGFTARLMSFATGDAFRHLFVNASRVDWQVRHRIDTTQNLLTATIWAEINESLPPAGIRKQTAILKLIKEVAFYQPQQSFEVVQSIFEDPSNILEEVQDRYENRYAPSAKSVRHDLAPVLQLIAYNLDYLPKAIDLLWEIAKDDDRETNQNPDHPMRVLEEIAGYSRKKSIGYNEVVIDAAKTWIKNSHNPGEVTSNSPFDVLEPILVATGTDTESSALKITIKRFAIASEAVRPLREAVIDLAMSEVLCSNPMHAVRAMNCIRESIRGPAEPSGGLVNDERLEAWTAEFIKTINELGALFIPEQLVDPVVAIAVRETLSWDARHSVTDTKSAANAVLDKIPDSIENRLALLLHDGWGMLHREAETSYEEGQVQRQENTKKLIGELKAKYSVAEILDQVSERLRIDQIAYDTSPGNYAPFIAMLVEVIPLTGIGICRSVAASPADNPLGLVVGVALSSLSNQDADTIALAHDLLEIESKEITWAVGQALGWVRGNRTTLLAGEFKLLASMATSNDEGARQGAAHAARRIGSFDEQAATRLIAMIDISTSANVAEEAIGIFGKYGSLRWDSVPKDLQDDVLAQLTRCPSINKHEVTSFLARLSKSSPDQLLGFLMDRIELSETGDYKEDYEPLPFRWQENLDFRSSSSFSALLSRILTWIQDDPTSWQRQTYGPRLVISVCGALDQEATSAINDYLQKPSQEKFKVAAVVLKEAGKSFAWHHQEFVVDMLRRAALEGTESLTAIEHALFSATNYGLRSGTPGEPFPEDVKQRDNAASIAAKLPTGSVERNFYEGLVQAAETSIRKSESDYEDLMEEREW